MLHSCRILQNSLNFHIFAEVKLDVDGSSLKTLLKLLLLILILPCKSLFAQLSDADSPYWREAGLPYIQNFSPKEINGNPQSWYIAQDDRDLIYVGNNHGLLIFDGAHWQLHQTPKHTAVRSILILGSKIYVGAQGELGYFEPTANGDLHYTSLIDSIPEEHRDFHDVWQTHLVGDAIYFRSPKYLFRWQNGGMKTWKSRNRYHTSHFVNGILYVREWGHGLLELRGDELEMVPGGEFFADMRLYGVLPYDQSRNLLITRNHGLFIYDGQTRTRLRSPVEKFLRQNRLYHTLALGNGLYALSTYRGGVVIIDKEGDICQIVNVSSGLRNNTVNHIFQDRDGGLWLALNNGLARIEWPGRLSRFSKSLGLGSTVLAVTRYKERLYVASHLGVHYLPDETISDLLKPAGTNNANFNWQQLFDSPFKSYPEITSQAWSFTVYKGDIYASASHGIFKLHDDRAELIINWPESAINQATPSKVFPNRIYVGLFHAFHVVDIVDGKWIDRGAVPGIELRTTSIVEEKDGTLWLGNHFGKVHRLRPKSDGADKDPSKLFAIDTWSNEDGLTNGHVKVAHVDNELMIVTQGGIRRFDAAQSKFVPEERFGKVFADPTTWVFYMRQDSKNNVWIVAGNDSTVFNGRAVRQADGSYRWDDREFRRMTDMGDMFTIVPEEDGTVWFGGSEGLARYYPLSRDNNRNIPTAIRKITNIVDQQVIYGGALPSGEITPQLEYEQNSMRIEFAAAAYDDITANRYQFKLDGFDADWSPWTEENRKDYTGLPEGDYTFRLRSRDIYGRTGTEALQSFSIKPPWHRSGLAYILYGLASLLLVWGIVQLSNRQLKKRQDKLEAIISERTAEVVDQRNQLKQQAEKLQEMDELKTRFFANISHEFRTPLTLIMGLIDKLRSRKVSSELEADYDVMNQNAARLLNLINQLLNLTRLEAGQLRLSASKNDISEFASRIFSSFGSLGRQKGLKLYFNGVDFESNVAPSAISIFFDREKMEKVIYNLLSNAFKFTPYGGEIHLDLAVTTSDDLASKPIVELSVKNTGPGIPPDKLDLVFDRFYQTGSEGTRQFEGTGIGLALVKELVELHQGTVSVESVTGQETCFTIQLPFGADHLATEEIVDIEPASVSDAPAKHIAVEALQSTLPVTAGPTDTGVEEEMLADEENDDTLILIVEDHHDLRRFIREQLEEDFRVVEAENGRIGRDKALELIPDLVISDVMMPEMDGYQLCDALKTNDKTNHVPIILLTAKAATADKIEGLETGADDYLLKPFNADELRIRVRNLIKIRRQMREKFSAEMLIGPSKVVVPSVNQVFLDRLKQVVEDHLDDESFSVEVFAREIGMSRGQLHRKLRALTNKSTSEFIRFFRLQRAAELIQQDAGNMAEIAYQVGFNSQAYFTRCFQEQFEMSPTEYRKKHAQS